MRKYYSEPELEIRKYSFVQGKVLTTSYPETGGSDGGHSLEDGDDYDIFGN